MDTKATLLEENKIIEEDKKALLRQIEKEQGNVSQYHEKQAALSSQKADLEIELLRSQETLAKTEQSRIQVTGEKRELEQEVTTIKKDIAEYLKKSKETPIVASKPVEAVPEKKLTEEEVKNMVANIEEKSERVRDDIADMAMSEQYLRTKQALLKAKKKEQEMQIAQRMASLREEEVIKMREKVSKMQVIFWQK